MLAGVIVGLVLAGFVLKFVLVLARLLVLGWFGLIIILASVVVLALPLGLRRLRLLIDLVFLVIGLSLKRTIELLHLLILQLLLLRFLLPIASLHILFLFVSSRMLYGGSGVGV